MSSDESDVVRRIQSLLDRAAADPELEMALRQDPWVVAEAEGISRDQTKSALDLHPTATDAEIAEALNQRVSHSLPGLDEIP